MKHKTRKLRRLKKSRKLKRFRKYYNKFKKTQKKGGVKKFLTALISLALGGFAISESGNNYKIPVCAGNTCRSTLAETTLETLLDDGYTIMSRGATVGDRKGSPMAPLSEYVGMNLCKGNTECATKVKAHESTQFDCNEIVNILRTNLNATVEIIPMDNKVEANINILMDKCELSVEEKSRLKIGFCDKKSPNIYDPYFVKGTDKEGRAYADTANKIYEEFIKAYGTNCPLQPPLWVDASKNGNPQIKNIGDKVYPGLLSFLSEDEEPEPEQMINTKSKPFEFPGSDVYKK